MTRVTYCIDSGILKSHTPCPVAKDSEDKTISMAVLIHILSYTRYGMPDSHCGRDGSILAWLTPDYHKWGIGWEPSIHSYSFLFTQRRLKIKIKFLFTQRRFKILLFISKAWRDLVLRLVSTWWICKQTASFRLSNHMFYPLSPFCGWGPKLKWRFHPGCPSERNKCTRQHGNSQASLILLVLWL